MKAVRFFILGLFLLVCFPATAAVFTPQPTTPVESTLMVGAISDTGASAKWAFQGKHQPGWPDYGTANQLTVLAGMEVKVRGYCWGGAKAGRLIYGPSSTEYYDWDPRTVRYHTIDPLVMNLYDGGQMKVQCWRETNRSLPPDSSQTITVIVLLNSEIDLALAVFRGDDEIVHAFDYVPALVDIREGDEVCIKDLGFGYWDPYRNLKARKFIAPGLWENLQLATFTGELRAGYQCLEIPSGGGGIQLPGSGFPLGTHRIHVKAKPFQSHLLPRVDILFRIRVSP